MNSGDLQIGSGSYGTVYLQKFNNQKAAVKRVRNERYILTKSTLYDVVFMNKVQSSYVVKFFQLCNCIGEYDEIYMEYAGIDMEKWIKKKEDSARISILETFLYQMISALAELHKKDIVHGDIKPSNILFDGTTFKLTDFGITSPCIRIEHFCYSELPFGPYEYCAPEALITDCKIKDYSKVDVWSLAMSILTIIYGYEYIYEGSKSETYMYLASKCNVDKRQFIQDVENQTANYELKIEHIPNNIENTIRSMLKINIRDRISVPELCKLFNICYEPEKSANIFSKCNQKDQFYAYSKMRSIKERLTSLYIVKRMESCGIIDKVYIAQYLSEMLWISYSVYIEPSDYTTNVSKKQFVDELYSILSQINYDIYDPNIGETARIYHDLNISISDFSSIPCYLVSNFNFKNIVEHYEQQHEIYSIEPDLYENVSSLEDCDDFSSKIFVLTLLNRYKHKTNIMNNDILLLALQCHSFYLMEGKIELTNEINDFMKTINYQVDYISVSVMMELFKVEVEFETIVEAMAEYFKNMYQPKYTMYEIFLLSIYKYITDEEILNYCQDQYKLLNKINK